MECHRCKTKIEKNDFYFSCDDCRINTCGDCGIDLDTSCPVCGGAMDHFNEDAG